VINHVLGAGGFTARLIQRLRVEEGIAYAAGSRFTLPRDTGVFYAATQTRTDQTVRAIRLMIEEISRLREDGVTEEEFADARSAILNSDIFRYVTPTQIVRQVAALEFDGFPLDQLQRAIAAYEAMSIEDVDAAARRYLHPDGLVMLAVGKAADLDTTLSVLGPLREIELETIE
jgi:zinc protease